MTNKYYEKNPKKHKQTNKKQRKAPERNQTLSEEEKEKKCQYYQ